MVKTKYINSFHIKIILILSLFTFSLQQYQCVLGKNCPLNQGICIGDFCKCLDGFYSLLDPNLFADQQIYCNYEQINVYIPLLLEMFLPSIGHFYAGKYWIGSLKLLLLIMHVSTSLILFGYIGVPKFVIFIIEKFGISLKSFFPEGLLGENKEEEEKKEDDNKTSLDTEGKDDEKNDELQKKASLTTSIVSIKYLLRGNQKQDQNNNNINRGNITQIKQVHNEVGNDIYNPEIEEPFIEKEENNEKEEEENEDNKDNKEKNTILEVIFKISTLFWVFWILDLFLFKFKVYNDGNDVPFVE